MAGVAGEVDLGQEGPERAAHLLGRRLGRVFVRFDAGMVLEKLNQLLAQRHGA
jgi:hypothetical protein